MTTSGSTTSQPNSSSTTTTTIAGAFSGQVTRDAIGHGCGLALAPSSPSAQGAPVGHCTVMEIGDSLGADLGYGLSRHLAANSGLKLLLYDRASTGLANSWFFNWPNHLAVDLAHHHPNLVIVCLGGNDEQNMTVNGNVLTWGTPAWKRAYLGYIHQIIGEANAAGAYVLWVGMPIMQPYAYNQGMTVLNALYQEGVTTATNATFVPVWSLFANPAGQFESQAAVDGTQTTLRASDGIHFSFSGEDVFATYVLREMAKIYHVDLPVADPDVVTHWG